MHFLTAIAVSAAAFLTVSAQNSAFPNFTGDPFIKYNISAPGISASFIPYGARLTNLFVQDKYGNPQDVVLGYDTGEQYLNDTETGHTYFGAVVGRYANRIKNGTFTIDGVKSQIPENEHGGQDTLHGGFIGYDQQNWTVVSQQNDSITFAFYDQAYQGFPGDVMNYATYTVSTECGTPRWTSRLVSIPFNSPTPIMLANHVYWNLGASVNTAAESILNDTLYMPYAARYIEFDGDEVPTGTIGVTKGGPLDFTTPTKIGTNINETVNGCGTGCTGYDNAFILDRPRYSGPEDPDLTVLTMSSPETGIKLDVKTNQQSLQIYTCDNLNGTIVAKAGQQHGNETTTYGQYGCIVIETQQWIDGINNPQWGQEQYQIYRVTEEPAVNLATYDFSITTD
ncbi:Galactose mutarotase [Hyphodiscus hymeniophilus]|uniref:Galactose mutarotase n=1 Tax=Hyphodiscus hymeniophilus TaxID=353542 RepID=A0A9P6VS56_9HELO|nr:Galactose mutarotase [Hyphodiscus hymeniophilus]